MAQSGTGSDSQLELVPPSSVWRGQGYLLGPTVGQVSLQQVSPGMLGPGIRRSLYGIEEEHSSRSRKTKQPGSQRSRKTKQPGSQQSRMNARIWSKAPSII